VHCQSPFLPGANTSDIGAKSEGEAENGPPAAGSHDHPGDRGAFRGLLLELGKTGSLHSTNWWYLHANIKHMFLSTMQLEF